MSNIVDETAAPRQLRHTHSGLSTSTMDDDVLSVTRQSSLSRLNSIYSDLTEYSDDRLLSPVADSSSMNLDQKRQPSPRMPLKHITESISPTHTRDHCDHPTEATEDEEQEDDGEPAALSPSTLSMDSDVDDVEGEELDNPKTIIERPISDVVKRERLSKLFARAASNGDLQCMIDMLTNFRNWIDIDYHDDDGSTPLILATCFGHVAAASMLLDAGAMVDARDRFGWTALVWATNNKHEQIVRVLLEHDASASTQTSKGRTVADFLRHDPNKNTKIAEIFQEPNETEGTTMKNGSSGIEDIMQEENWGAASSIKDNRTLSHQDQAEEEEEDEIEFNWEFCLPDQMFVFSSKDVNHIIKVTITSMEPARSRTREPISAYILFLAARFAHYYSTPELLVELLDAASSAILFVTECKSSDMNLIAYWICNTSALLHFMRKDPGLHSVSSTHQDGFEALILDMVQMVVLDAERRIEHILELAMLDHDTILGLDTVKFQRDWAFSFWRGSAGGNSRTETVNRRASVPSSPIPAAYSPQLHKRTSLQPPLPRPTSLTHLSISPRTVTTMLSSLLFLMQSYDIHPEIIHQVITQLLHYISCEIFNHMLDNRRFLSRSKALQTRLNLSVLEDWLCNNCLPSRLSDQLAPVVQLLQLLQVLSQQTDLTAWIETCKKLEHLNPVQIKCAVTSYRYEVNESRLPAEIVKYVLQVATESEEGAKRIQDRKDGPMQTASRGSSTPSTASSPRGSSDTQGANVVSDSAEVELVEAGFQENEVVTSVRMNSGGIEKQTVEERRAVLLSDMRRSRGWIPFAIPADLAARGRDTARVFVPQIPEEMVVLLDSNNIALMFP
ncbi:hypothetical protein BGZ51_005749 [Haplosporangium sp. Z 767]|nr:hypothetical protein BGZ50_004768 [Haplosporangium sp. Z 11]KAF9192356.1 hypothetical protein BGZ51_005749 [Haplosporangium sp. Z 767]